MQRTTKRRGMQFRTLPGLTWLLVAFLGAPYGGSVATTAWGGEARCAAQTPHKAARKGAGVTGKQKHAQTTGVEGVATIGPVMPVSRPGEPNTRPLANAVITVRAAAEAGAPRPDGAPRRRRGTALAEERGAVVARVRCDSRGHFRIVLPPGTYRLV